MNFGQYAILTPIKHTFEKEPQWYWLIEPPTAKDELEVAKILATDKSKIEGDGTRVSMMPLTLEIAMREIAVTFGGTNIPTSESHPEPVLKNGASVAEVEEVLKQMPRGMVLELWKAVGDAIPGWGPLKAPARKSETTDEAKN